MLNWGCIHTCLFWFDWIELKFVSLLGAYLLSRCEYSKCTQVRTKQPYRDPAEEVVSVRFQIYSGKVEWMSQWMDDLKRTCGFVYSFWFTCKKGSVKANRTKKKKFTIAFGPVQSKWTSGLPWCEYTRKLTYSQLNRLPGIGLRRLGSGLFWLGH